MIGADTEAGEPLEPRLDPVFMPDVVRPGLAEILHLHLLELTVPKDEMAGRDLVAERAALLGDSERQLPAHRRDYVLEIDKHCLRCLRTEVSKARLVFYRADVGLEHQIERPRLRELTAGAAV